MSRCTLDGQMESAVSGFWGEDNASPRAVRMCRVIRNGDVGKDGRIGRDALPVRWFSDSEYERALVRETDTILVSSGAYTGNVGRLTASSGDQTPVVVSNFVRRIRAKPGVDPDWLFQLLRSAEVQAQVPSFVGGSAMPNLQRDFYAGCRVPCAPHPDEQAVVVRVLTSIDRVIDKTEALLSKHQRIKTGLMRDLLTYGIDGQGRLRNPASHRFKQSSLGMIPEDWDVCELAKCTKERITYGIVQAGPHVPGGVPYIRTGDMSGEELIREQLLCTAPEIAARFKRSEVRAGEIVCAIRATIGKVLSVPPELDGANLTQGTARISPAVHVDAGFLLWALRSASTQNELHLQSKGTTFAEITLTDLRRAPVAVPRSIEEQQRIGLIMARHELSVRAQSTHLAKLRRLKAGLVQDLFSGGAPIASLLAEPQLTLAWA